MAELADIDELNAIIRNYEKKKIEELKKKLTTELMKCCDECNRFLGNQEVLVSK